MVNIDLNELDCCGVGELNGISEYPNDPRGAVIDILTDEDPSFEADDEARILAIPNKSHLIFTQAQRTRVRISYGNRLAAYITQQRLGAVVQSAPARSPNTGNYITVFVWALDKAAIRRWAKRNKFVI